MLQRYNDEKTMLIKVEIDLGEMDTAILCLEDSLENEEKKAGQYQRVELLKTMKKVRRAAIEEATQTFNRLLERA
tara:strand:- start:675 stop:899 length:225 start_codon:yes stop_codon:yes gene_type:complete